METVNQIEYNGALYNIQDAEAQKNLVYSQNEIDTGKIWIDGKKIYRKVINCGVIQNGTLNTIPTNIMNMEKVVKITAMATSKAYKLTTQIPYTSAGGKKKTIYIQNNNIYIYIDTVEETYDECFAILEYTKKTN